MQPDQPNGFNNQYDFIVNPGSAPKKSLIPSLGGQTSFTKKLIFIAGGALLLIILMWIVGTIIGGGSNNTVTITKLVQHQAEIARVATEGEKAARGDIRNAAMNIKLSLSSQQQEWVQFLATRGTELKPEDQSALENAATDQQLENARSNNTFDKTFLQIMQSYLTDYASTVQTDFNASGSDAERELLRSHFNQVQLLLEQLPKT